MSTAYWLGIYRSEVKRRRAEQQSFNNLWNEIEEEYQQDLDEAKRIYDAKREALSVLWEEDNLATPIIEKKEMSQIVRETVPQMGENFTVKDVRDRLFSDHPYIASTVHPSSISGILGRMKREGSISELSRGAGPIPSRYAYVG